MSEESCVKSNELGYDPFSQKSTARTRRLALFARRSTILMCSNSGAAHVGSSLSVIDILAVLYSGSANISPAKVKDLERDLIIVSKGHAAAGVYAVLGIAGFFPIEWLDAYCSDGSPLGGHVTKGSVPGVEFSTGSLGHGLPFGTGSALAKKRLNVAGRVFVVLSDGECDEGSNWEAALLASHHRLDRLVVLIDRNGIQSLDSTEKTMRLEPLAEKWAAFGWHVQEVDGHDHETISNAIDDTEQDARPSVIICSTIKGKGVSFMENQVLWHYRSPIGDDLETALNELNEGA